MVKSDFNVLVKSSNRYTGTTVTDSTYLFDFDKFDKGKYEVSFCFFSLPEDLQNMDGAFLYIDFGNTNTYVCNASQTNAQKSLFFGTIIPVESSTTVSALRARPKDNHPIIMDRPSSNQFNVKILDFDNGPYQDLLNTDLNGYTMVLNFKKIED